ncbi:hypothetical protein AJ79_10169 [Helicocarpus griseus UAMH5409]|uniref:AMP-dependent synthetase/ligase domain-containing protein n=1 Tax=Helicocarpus griseus UAMH5409 TaxID=1447875 RepID=A0A2B7WF74_9EURO|nr:hypothetical protein AJ79_10169 [Helicocarpus griseus UAMH5409]
MTFTTLSPCLFPIIEHNVEPIIGHAYFKDSDTFRGNGIDAVPFCNAHSTSVLTLYSVAWALMLRKYLNTDDVYFGIAWGLCTLDDNPENQSWCFIRISETDSILDILQRLESDPRKGCPDNNMKLLPGPFNTEVHMMVEDMDSYLKNWTRTQCPHMIDIRLCVSAAEFAFRARASSMNGLVPQGLAETMKRVITNIMRDPNKTVGELDILCSWDRTRIESWNRKDPRKHVINACIPDLIRLQMFDKPERLASDGWDGPMTFNELWKQSSRLCRYLQERGVKQGIRVFFSMHLSKWAIIAMLAVLRTGAACVPIDLLDPAHEIKTISEKLVIASPAQVDQLFGEVDYIITDLPDFMKLLPPGPDVSEPQVSPQDVAFIMFTSGSNDSPPKPVVLDHTAVCTSIMNLAEVLQITDESRIFQCSTYNSNVSIADIFGTMGKGGCVCYVNANENKEIDLSESIASAQATHVLLSPSMLRELSPGKVPSLKVISVIGDGLTVDDVLKWQDHVLLYHLYGSGECTVCSTATNSQHKERLKWHRRLNIGYGMGCRTWIADPSNPHAALVPVGGVGELLIEGGILARGYFVSDEEEQKQGVDEKTAASFIYDPEWLASFPRLFMGESRVRMYRTGELVRYEHDGSLRFMGRLKKKEGADCPPESKPD